ncbi:enoyl-CoA-hydratase DpgB [Streptomyces mangrovisoli]|uniref:enoyl-CoA-hydratase DpgB n=1 Tax=Streptomyces mangrovisoli TaxID=1428628 RepID=UPI000696E9A4|nr:enoyl-CoA-hydratase DpgB [Streptomyces mangrovisoli]
MTTDIIKLAGGAAIVLDLDTSADALPLRQLTQAADRAEDAPGSVVLLKLAGGALPEVPGGWPQGAGVHDVNKWERVLRRLERLPAAVIAAVDGPVDGPALELLLAADYRIATPQTVIRPPFLGGEPWPGMLLHRLAQQAGAAATRRIALFGADIPAERALSTGIVDEVVDAGELAAALQTVVEAAGEVAGKELAIRRRLVLDATTTSFEESLGAHLSACDRVLRRERAEGRAGERSAA